MTINPILQKKSSMSGQWAEKVLKRKPFDRLINYKIQSLSNLIFGEVIPNIFQVISNVEYSTTVWLRSPLVKPEYHR